jgi:hypothetical protein
MSELPNIAATLQLRFTTFPGRAGELQRAGATASLIKELGANYESYHTFLAEEFKRIGRPTPTPDGGEKALTAYLDQWARLQDLARAEVVLRSSQRFVAGGAFGPDWTRDGPLLEPGGNSLGSVTDPRPAPADTAAPMPETARPGASPESLAKP